MDFEDVRCFLLTSSIHADISLSQCFFVFFFSGGRARMGQGPWAQWARAHGPNGHGPMGPDPGPPPGGDDGGDGGDDGGGRISQPLPTPIPSRPGIQ